MSKIVIKSEVFPLTIKPKVLAEPVKEEEDKIEEIPLTSPPPKEEKSHLVDDLLLGSSVALFTYLLQGTGNTQRVNKVYYRR